MSHGTFFTTVGNVTLNNGSTLTGGNGVFAGFQTFNLRGSITVDGTGGSVITTTGTTFTGVHLGVNGPNDFIVNSTGAAADLTVAVPLLDRPGNNVGAGQLRKTGAGTMVLTAANTYTGSTLVNEGTLEVNGGSISGPHSDHEHITEFIELPTHPFFIATQAHPELKSTLLRPAPLFMGLVDAAIMHKSA